MNWHLEYISDAENDLRSLDRLQQIQVLKAIRKVSIHPLPASESGYGKPLCSKRTSNLTGYFKIKLLYLGIRVVYALVREDQSMRVIVISVMNDNEVYRMAASRIDK